MPFWLAEEFFFLFLFFPPRPCLLLHSLPFPSKYFPGQLIFIGRSFTPGRIRVGHQMIVSCGDLLELLPGSGSLIAIGVVFQRQLPVCKFDLFPGSSAVQPQDPVIILCRQAVTFPARYPIPGIHTRKAVRREDGQLYQLNLKLNQIACYCFLYFFLITMTFTVSSSPPCSSRIFIISTACFASASSLK